MKKLVSISVFVFALMIGLYLPNNSPTIYEKIYPALTQDEISPLIGKRVINKTNENKIIVLGNLRGTKFTLENNDTKVEFFTNGESGEIVSLSQTLKMKELFWQNLMKNCGLLVKWDKKSVNGNDMFSCHSRFTKRVFLDIQ